MQASETLHTIRDLEWVIASPFLMEETLHPAFAVPEFLRALNKIITPPEALADFSAHPKPYALGRYFEQLLAFWLAHHPDVIILARNLQVTDNNQQTLGEFDFLLRHQEQIYHLEAAVKFYLGLGESKEWHHWVGPKTRDRLDIKLHKLLERQITLSMHPVAKRVLAEHGIPDNVYIASHIFLKGYFFYPFATYIENRLMPPHHASPKHLRGWWLELPEIMQLEEWGKSLKWQILPKHRWLSPALITDEEEPLPLEQLRTHITEMPLFKESALLITGIKKEESEWREVTRGFIVPGGWPGTIFR